jgi:hypothetical protein
VGCRTGLRLDAGGLDERREGERAIRERERQERQGDETGVVAPERSSDRPERQKPRVDEDAVEADRVGGLHPAGDVEHGGEQPVVEDEEGDEREGGAGRPAGRRAPLDPVEHRPREKRRRDEVADVEDEDVPVAALPEPFRHDGERNHERRQRRRQDEGGGEDRGERELRPLVLRPVRTEEMGDRNEREEDGEGDPVAALDGFGPAERGHERDRREDDHELEPRRLAAEAAIAWVVAVPHVTSRTVSARPGRPRIPRTGDPSLDRVTETGEGVPRSRDGG